MCCLYYAVRALHLPAPAMAFCALIVMHGRSRKKGGGAFGISRVSVVRRGINLLRPHTASTTIRGLAEESRLHRCYEYCTPFDWKMYGGGKEGRTQIHVAISRRPGESKAHGAGVTGGRAMSVRCRKAAVPRPATSSASDTRFGRSIPYSRASGYNSCVNIQTYIRLRLRASSLATWSH